MTEERKMPEPVAYLLNGTQKLAETSECSYAVLVRTPSKHTESLPLHTADQLREAWNAALEAAAEKCDVRAESWSMQQGDDDPAYAYWMEEAGNCASAIRSLRKE